jgi:hypothetical protein
MDGITGTTLGVGIIGMAVGTLGITHTAGIAGIHGMHGIVLAGEAVAGTLGMAVGTLGITLMAGTIGIMAGMIHIGIVLDGEVKEVKTGMEEIEIR